MRQKMAMFTPLPMKLRNWGKHCRALPRTPYRQPSEADRAKGQFDSEGLMDLSKLEGAFSDPTMQFYLCGPVGFMQFAAKQLVDLGVKQENIHYECFGPHKVL